MNDSFAVLCPGQGCQRAGMLRLVENEPAARPVLAALRAQIGAEMLAMIAGEEGDAPDEIFANAVAQPLVVAGAMAHWAALRELGLPMPIAFLGYSVGELAAHGCAETFDVETILRLARARADAMDAAAAETLPANGGGLLAVRGLPDALLEELAREAGLEVAIDNGPMHRVLGGPTAALDAGERLAQNRGAPTVRRLCVSVPAHTSWLQPASGRFHETLSAAAARTPKAPVLAGIDGSPVRDAARSVETLSAQLSQPIRWAACLHTAWELGARVFLELGPGDALSRMARELLPLETEARSVSEFRTLDGVMSWINRAA